MAQQKMRLSGEQIVSSWGWLPWLAPVAALGVVMMALADSASVSGRPYAMLIFWAGVLIIALPVALRMLNPAISKREALGLLILAGEMFFLGTISGALAGRNGYDELLHWRTASDILTTGHLFTPNSLLPVSPYYPGLEIVTTTIAGLTGLSIYPSGYVVVFIARLIMLASLFSIFLNISGSVRAAALGGLIYMGSTTFFFFDSQFAYESLSLPLAALVIWMVLKLSKSPADQRFGWSASILLVELMVVITHHVTSFFLAGILLVWTALALLRRWSGKDDFVPYQVSTAVLIAVLAWLLLVADITIGYLAPYIGGTLTTLLALIQGAGGNRAAAGSSAGSPLSERVTAIASVLVLLTGLAMGGWVWLRTKLRTPSFQGGLPMILAGMALVYPLLPVLRLNNTTWEVSNRSSSFVYMGLSFVIGVGLVELRMSHLNAALGLFRRRTAAAAVGLVICGGIISGSPASTRLPGPYLVEADSRSIDSYGLSAANWAHSYLGPDNRMASDRVQSVLMGSVGMQTMVFRAAGDLNISPLFLKPAWGPAEVQEVNTLRLHYLVIDQRVTQGKPLFGYYFEAWEQQVVPAKVPLPPALLAKFDQMPNVSRIFDNGNIRIYDLGGLLSAP